MNAQELFEQSKKAYQHRCLELQKGELPPRIINALGRAGYIKRDEHGQFCGVDKDKLRQHVLDGRIWEVRNIGQKSIQLICEWLERQEHAN